MNTMCIIEKLRENCIPFHDWDKWRVIVVHDVEKPENIRCYIDALLKLDQDLLVVQFKDSDGTMEKSTGPSTVRIRERAPDEYSFNRSQAGPPTAVLL